MKKTIKMQGHIVFPLKEGVSAYIACSKGIIQTSRVVEIISVTDEYSEFETMNSRYRVSFEKSPAVTAQAFLKCA